MLHVLTKAFVGISGIFHEVNRIEHKLILKLLFYHPYFQRMKFYVGFACAFILTVVDVECKLVNAATQTDQSIAFDTGLDDVWVAFKKTHNKKYKPDEEFSR